MLDRQGDEDLTGSGLGRIFETKRLKLVLVDVGGSNTTILGGFNASEVLKTLVINSQKRAEAIPDEFMDNDEVRQAHRSIS